VVVVTSDSSCIPCSTDSNHRVVGVVVGWVVVEDNSFQDRYLCGRNVRIGDLDHIHEEPSSRDLFRDPFRDPYQDHIQDHIQDRTQDRSYNNQLPSRHR